MNTGCVQNGLLSYCAMYTAHYLKKIVNEHNAVCIPRYTYQTVVISIFGHVISTKCMRVAFIYHQSPCYGWMDVLLNLDTLSFQLYSLEEPGYFFKYNSVFV